jgi:hypothetical protein
MSRWAGSAALPAARGRQRAPLMNPEEPIMPLSSQDRLRSTMKIKRTA